MKYYLYEFEDNWADEMDLAGFAILTEIEKDIALAKIRKEYKKGGSIGFGSNQDNEYDTLSDVMNTISFKKITEAEYNVIKKTLGVTFGETGPLDTSDLEEDEYGDEEEYADKDEYGDDYEEEEYELHADAVTQFIKKELGLEQTISSEFYSLFIWKPTPYTELRISVGKYYDGEQEDVEMHLKYKNKDVKYEFFRLEDVFNNPEFYIQSTIRLRRLIEKAKKY
jgi:hypothetical protein